MERSCWFRFFRDATAEAVPVVACIDVSRCKMINIPTAIPKWITYGFIASEALIVAVLVSIFLL